MIRLRSIVLLAAAATLSISAAVTPTLAAPVAARPPKVGELAPDFKLADQKGRAVTLSAARGEKVVLVFYRGYW